MCALYWLNAGCFPMALPRNVTRRWNQLCYILLSAPYTVKATWKHLRDYIYVCMYVCEYIWLLTLHGQELWVFFKSMLDFMIFLEKPKVSSLFLNTAKHSFNLRYSNYPDMLLLFILYKIWSQYAPKRIDTHTTSQWVKRADTFIAHTHCCTPTCLPPVSICQRDGARG